VKYLLQPSNRVGMKRITALLIAVIMLLGTFATVALVSGENSGNNFVSSASSATPVPAMPFDGPWWLDPDLDHLGGRTPHETIVASQTIMEWDPGQLWPPAQFRPPTWLPVTLTPDVQLARAIQRARHDNAFGPDNPMIIALEVDIMLYSVPMPTPDSATAPIHGGALGILSDILPMFTHISDRNGRSFQHDENVILVPSVPGANRVIDFDPVNSIHPNTGANLDQSGQGRRHFELETPNSSLTLLQGITLTTSGADSFFNGGGVDVFNGATLNINGGNITGVGTSLLHVLHTDESWFPLPVNINPFSRYFGVPLIPPNMISASMSRGLVDLLGGSDQPRGVRGGGIRVNGANSTVNFIRGNVSNNSVFYHVINPAAGGGIALESGATLNIHDGAVIEGNLTRSDRAWGGGVYAWGAGTTVNMFGGVIRNNESRYRGGGVKVNTGATFNMFGGEIYGNEAQGFGAGVSNEGTFNMFGGAIHNNTTDAEDRDSHADFNRHGGGVSVDRGGVFNMFSPNTAPETVVGIRTPSVSLLMPARAIAVATATEDNPTPAIHNNYARTDGGGVHVGSGRFNMYYGYITQNIARRNGGGMFLSGHLNTHLIGGTITGNIANNGGAIYAAEPVPTPTNFYTASRTNPNLENLQIHPEYFVLNNNYARNGMLVCTRTANWHNGTNELSPRSGVDLINPCPQNTTVGPGAIIENYPIGSPEPTGLVATPAHAFTNHDINTRGTQLWQVRHYLAGGHPIGAATRARISGVQVPLLDNNGAPVLYNGVPVMTPDLPSGSWVPAGTEVVFSATPGASLLQWVRTNSTEYNPPRPNDNRTEIPAAPPALLPAPLPIPGASSSTQTITNDTGHVTMVAQFSQMSTVAVGKRVVYYGHRSVPGSVASLDRETEYYFRIYFRTNDAIPVPLEEGTRVDFVGYTNSLLPPLPPQVAPASGYFILDEYGSATFRLRSYQRLEFTVPIGIQVRVIEEVAFAYKTYIWTNIRGEGYDFAGNPTIDFYGITGNDTGWQLVDSLAEVNYYIFNNHRLLDRLTLTKYVRELGTPGAIVDDLTTEYQFTVTFRDRAGNPLPAGIEITVGGTASGSQTPSDRDVIVLGEGGTYTFTMRNRQTYTFYNLRVGTEIRVVERHYIGYNVTIDVAGQATPITGRDTGFQTIRDSRPSVTYVETVILGMVNGWAFIPPANSFFVVDIPEHTTIVNGDISTGILLHSVHESHTDPPYFDETLREPGQVIKTWDHGGNPFANRPTEVSVRVYVDAPGVANAITFNNSHGVRSQVGVWKQVNVQVPQSSPSVTDLTTAYNFTIQFFNAAGIPLPAGVHIHFTGYAPSASGQVAPADGIAVTGENGIVSFDLRHMQQIVFTNIPVGYRVIISEDVDLRYYTTHIIHWTDEPQVAGNISNSLSTGMLIVYPSFTNPEEGALNFAVFVNTRLLPEEVPVNVTKVVREHNSANNTWDIGPDVTTEYRFEVFFRDADNQPIVGREFQLVGYSTNAAQTVVPANTTRTTDENGRIVFYLRNHQRFQIQNVPRAYQVNIVEVLPRPQDYYGVYWTNRVVYETQIVTSSPNLGNETGFFTLNSQRPAATLTAENCISFTNLRTHSTLDVSMVVEGMLGNRLLPREHTIAFSGITEPTRMYFVGGVVDSTGATAPASGHLYTDASGQVTFPLMHGQRKTFLSVPLSDTVQLESIPLTSGIGTYHVTYVDSINPTPPGDNQQTTVLPNASLRYVAFTHTHVYDIPTGITVTSGNALLIVVLLGMAGVMFTVKIANKRRAYSR